MGLLLIMGLFVMMLWENKEKGEKLDQYVVVIYSHKSTTFYQDLHKENSRHFLLIDEILPPCT